MGWTGGHVPPTLFYTLKDILKNNIDSVGEWSALQTGNWYDSSSIPAEVKNFFKGIKSLETYFALFN